MAGFIYSFFIVLLFNYSFFTILDIDAFLAGQCHAVLDDELGVAGHLPAPKFLVQMCTVGRELGIV